MECLQLLVTLESKQDLATCQLLQQGYKMTNPGKNQCDNAKQFWEEESRKSLIPPVRISHNWKIRRVAT